MNKERISILASKISWWTELLVNWISSILPSHFPEEKERIVRVEAIEDVLNDFNERLSHSGFSGDSAGFSADPCVSPESIWLKMLLKTWLMIQDLLCKILRDSSVGWNWFHAWRFPTPWLRFTCKILFHFLRIPASAWLGFNVGRICCQHFAAPLRKLQFVLEGRKG